MFTSPPIPSPQSTESMPKMHKLAESWQTIFDGVDAAEQYRTAISKVEAEVTNHSVCLIEGGGRDGYS